MKEENQEATASPKFTRRIAAEATLVDVCVSATHRLVSGTSWQWIWRHRVTRHAVVTTTIWSRSVVPTWWSISRRATPAVRGFTVAPIRSPPHTFWYVHYVLPVALILQCKAPSTLATMSKQRATL